MVMKYAGSFGQGFIEAFLAAQNLAEKRRHNLMMQNYYDFMMRQQGYDRASGKYIDPKTGIPTYNSPDQYNKALRDFYGTGKKKMIEPYSGGSPSADGSGGGYEGGAYKGGPQAEAHGQEMAKYLQDNYGYTPAGAAAAVGNAWQESSFASNFAPGGDKGASKGMFQWKDDRNVDAQNWMQQNNKDPNDWRSHLDYMAHEVATDPRYKSLNNILKTTNDPDYATKTFFSKFERGDPAEANMPNRVGMANKVFSGTSQPTVQTVTGPNGRAITTGVAKTKAIPSPAASTTPKVKPTPTKPTPTPSNADIADIPSPAAQPAEAQTPSPGGGFVVPPGGMQVAGDGSPPVARAPVPGGMNQPDFTNRVQPLRAPAPPVGTPNQPDFTPRVQPIQPVVGPVTPYRPEDDPTNRTTSTYRPEDDPRAQPIYAPAIPPPRPTTPVVTRPPPAVRPTPQPQPDPQTGHYIPTTGTGRGPGTWVSPSGVQQPPGPIAPGPEPIWVSYNAPASLRPSPVQVQPPPPAALPPNAYSNVNDSSNYSNVASAPNMDDMSAGEAYANEDLGFARGGAIPYGSYQFIRKYQDGGDVDYSSAPTDTTPVVSSDASVQGDTQQAQQGAAQMGAAAGAMGSSASKAYSTAQDRKYDQALRNAYTPNQSKTGTGAASLWNIPGRIGQAFQQSPAGRFFQNPGQAIQAIPGSIAQNFNTSPVGQMLSGASSYQRGGRVTPRVKRVKFFDDGGSTGEGVTGSVSTGDDSATNTTNVGGVSAVTGTTDTGFGVADMGHAGPDASGGAGAEGGGSGTSATSAAPGLAAVVNSMTNAIFGSPASAQTVSPSVKNSLNQALSQLAEARGTTVAQLLGPSAGNTGLSPAAIAALRASNYSGDFMGHAGASGPGMGVDIGGGTTVVSQSPPDAPKSTSQLAPGFPGPRGGAAAAANSGAVVAPSQFSGVAGLGPAQQAQLRAGLAGLGQNMGFPAAGLANVGPSQFASSGSAPPGSNIGVATISGGLGGPGAGGVAGAPRGVPSPGMIGPGGPNGPSANASSMMGPGAPAPAPGAPGTPPGMANQGYGGAGLAMGAQAVSQAPPTGGAFHAAPMPNVGRVAKGGPIQRPIRRYEDSVSRVRVNAYAAGGPVTYFANGGGVDEQPVVQPNPIDYSGSYTSPDGGSDLLAKYGPGGQSDQDDQQDAMDERQMAQLAVQGPSEDGLPIGAPQITDSYGNPSQSVSDGLLGAGKILVADNSISPSGGIPTPAEATNRDNFGSSDGAMDSGHVSALENTVDPHDQLSPGMKHLAVIDNLNQFGALSDHKNDSDSAIAAYTLSLRDQSMKHGADAVALLKKGDTEGALQSMVKSYDNIPDGLTVGATVNKDGTIHVTQRNLKGVVTWQGDVSEQDVANGALHLAAGTAFWGKIGENIAKYDPATGRNIPIDPHQADFATANRQWQKQEDAIHNKYYRGNDLLINNGTAVVHMPEPPTSTGNQRIDQMNRNDFTRDMTVYNAYAKENNRLFQNEAGAAHADFTQQYLDARHQHEAAQANAYKQADEQRRAEAQAAKPFNLGDTYKEDSEGKTSILEAAGATTLGTKTTPGIVSSDEYNAATHNQIFLPEKEDQNTVRQAIGEIYAYSHGNIPMDTAADLTKSLFNVQDPRKDIQATQLDKNRYQFTVPGRPGRQRSFIVSTATAKDLDGLLSSVYAQRAARGTGPGTGRASTTNRQSVAPLPAVTDWLRTHVYDPDSTTAIPSQ